MKTFRCVALSKNRNSFGIRGTVFIARDGEVWEVGVHMHDEPKVGVDYGVLERDKDFGIGFSRAFGWEIPRRLLDAPPEVLKKIFPE